MNHTPTPWGVEYVYGGKAAMVYARIYEVGHKSQSVGFAGIYKRTTKDEAIANAQFIVRACNAHDAMIHALNEFLELSPYVSNTDSIAPALVAACKQARAALKLARGE